MCLLLLLTPVHPFLPLFHCSSSHASRRPSEPQQPLPTGLPDLPQLHIWPRTPTLKPSTALSSLQGDSGLCLLPQQTPIPPLTFWAPSTRVLFHSLDTPFCFSNVPSVSKALPPDPFFWCLHTYCQSHLLQVSDSFVTSSQGPHSLPLEHLSQFILTCS